MAPIDRTRNLVLSEPVNLGSPGQRDLTGVAAPAPNSGLQPNNAQLRGIFGSLSEAVRNIPDVPGLTHTAPTRAAGAPFGTTQAGTVVFERSRSFETNDGTGVRLGLRGEGSYLSDEAVRRNLDLGGGTTTGVGRLNLGFSAAAGSGSLEAIGQPGSLQPTAGVQVSGQVENIGGRPVYRGEVRATVAGTQAALGAFGRTDSTGQRAVGIQGVVRPFPGATLNLDVTATDGPRAGDARLTGRVGAAVNLGGGVSANLDVTATDGQRAGDARLTGRAGIAADLGNGFTANGYVQREVGGDRGINSAGFRLQYQLRF